ncbi:MAG TPA: hypothetical protein PLJ24_11685, partial [Anaerolineae bacterium]|nr:hypothetical protein [Anaerolineae bacterium]
RRQALKMAERVGQGDGGDDLPVWAGVALDGVVEADRVGQVLGKSPIGGDVGAEFGVIEADDLPFPLAERRLAERIGGARIDDSAEQRVEVLIRQDQSHVVQQARQIRFVAIDASGFLGDVTSQ